VGVLAPRERKSVLISRGGEEGEGDRKFLLQVSDLKDLEEGGNDPLADHNARRIEKVIDLKTKSRR